MLNVDTIKNGLVIDHIKAGGGPKIFSWLGLDKATYSVALILNVHSNRHGKKDIVKIDNIINIDYSVLGFIDPNITVNVVSVLRTTSTVTAFTTPKSKYIITDCWRIRRKNKFLWGFF